MINLCVIGLGYVGLPLAVEFGKKLINAVKALGDHMLALMHLFQTLGLGKVVSAVPNRNLPSLYLPAPNGPTKGRLV